VAEAVRARWVVASPSPRIASTRIRALLVVRELQKLGVDAGLAAESDQGGDVTVFCKSYSDRDIALARRLRGAGTRVIFDLCDNHFLLSADVVRRLGEMMEAAHAWVFSTPELRRACEQRLAFRRPAFTIADAVETQQSEFSANGIARWLARGRFALWKARTGIEAHREQRLLWFGNHVGSVADSGMILLSRLRTILEEAALRHSATLTLVSNSATAYRRITKGWRIRTFYLPWNLATFQEVLKLHSIAVIPFIPSEFNVVKSSNRLAMALYNGVAVVADSIPSYQEFADCAILDDWRGLDRYLSDPGLRVRHVALAQERISNGYLPGQIARNWLDTLEAVRCMES
jgi:hypothetical protein